MRVRRLACALSGSLLGAALAAPTGLRAQPSTSLTSVAELKACLEAGEVCDLAPGRYDLGDGVTIDLGSHGRGALNCNGATLYSETATPQPQGLLHFVLGKRPSGSVLTVQDCTLECSPNAAGEIMLHADNTSGGVGSSDNSALRLRDVRIMAPPETSACRNGGEIGVKTSRNGTTHAHWLDHQGGELREVARPYVLDGDNSSAWRRIKDVQVSGAGPGASGDTWCIQEGSQSAHPRVWTQLLGTTWEDCRGLQTNGSALIAENLILLRIGNPIDDDPLIRHNGGTARISATLNEMYQGGGSVFLVTLGPGAGAQLDVQDPTGSYFTPARNPTVWETSSWAMSGRVRAVCGTVGCAAAAFGPQLLSESGWTMIGAPLRAELFGVIHEIRRDRVGEPLVRDFGTVRPPTGPPPAACDDGELWWDDAMLVCDGGTFRPLVP